MLERRHGWGVDAGGEGDGVSRRREEERVAEGPLHTWRGKGDTKAHISKSKGANPIHETIDC